MTKSFKVLLDTPIQLEGIETDQNPLPKLNENLLSQIPQLIDIQPDLDQMKHDIGNAITDVEQIKIETSNPVPLTICSSDPSCCGIDVVNDGNSCILQVYK